MPDFIVDGGPPMILLLIFGTIMVVFASLYARRPSPHRLRFLKGLSIATTWIVIGGFASALRVTLDAAARLPDEMKGDFHLVIAMGSSESLTNVILGAVFLSLTWFIASIGLRRTDAV